MNAPVRHRSKAAGPVRFRIKGTGLYVDPVASSTSAFTPAQQPHEAASLGPRLAQWRPPSSGPNAVHYDFATLRTRSRDQVRNNGLADTGVSGLVANIVGTGIKPQFRTPDRDFNRKLADLWDEWTDESDADGRLDFYGQQALAVRSMIEGGDCFGRLRQRRASDGLSVPFQVQLLEGEYCPEWKTEIAGNGNSTLQGIEFDLIGNRVAYWLYRQHPGDMPLALNWDNQPVRVLANDVVHLYDLRRPGAVRGNPWLTRALVKLKDLDKYDDAQLLRQQIAALFAGFVHDENGDDEDVFSGQADPDSSGAALASLEPGTMQMLPPGKTVEWSAPPSPGGSYLDFVKAQHRAVAASIGVLYEMLTGDYSAVNDRTWRAAVSEFRRRCEMLQHHLAVFQFCRPILWRWVDLAILSGALELPAGITAKQVKRARWLPVPWPYINPVQDVDARAKEIRGGLKSRSQVVSEQGFDVDELDREIAQDNARVDELELVFDTDPRKVTKSTLTVRD